MVLIFILMVGGAVGGGFSFIMAFEKEAKKNIRKIERKVNNINNDIKKIKNTITKQKKILGEKKDLFYPEKKDEAKK